MFPVSIDISIYRRTRNELLFRIPKDLSGYDVYFVAKENKNIGGTKIIEKISTTPGQLTKSYTYPYTYLTVNILPADTDNLANERYYYEIYAVNQSDATDVQVYFYGKMTLILSVSTTTDAAQSLASIQYYVLSRIQRLSLGSTLTLSDEGQVFVYDTDDDTVYTWVGDNWR